MLSVKVGGRTFYASLANGSSAEAFAEKLTSEPMTVDMRDCGGGKIGSLPWELTRSDESVTAELGDIMLCRDGRIALYYDRDAGEFTRLANIGNVTGEELLSYLGEGDVSVGFRIEYGE